MMAVPDQARTTAKPVRINSRVWEIFGSLCARLDTDRSSRIRAHVHYDIEEYGTDDERTALREALEAEELRRPGRQRKLTDRETDVIRAIHDTGRFSQAEIARIYKIVPERVAEIVDGDT